MEILWHVPLHTERSIRMRTLLVAVLFLAVTLSVEAWLPQSRLIAQVKRTTSAALIASSLLLSGTPALADLDSDYEVTSTTAAVRVIGVRDAATPLVSAQDAAAAKSAAGAKAGSLTDDSYRSSLEKEQKKQKAREKSKLERSRDLCESLGRGC